VTRAESKPIKRLLEGCRRCRGTGSILVLLCRIDRRPEELACKCSCEAAQNYRALMQVDRLISAWQPFGATVIEWPTVAERRAA
jgi:hypothetical protein